VVHECTLRPAQPGLPWVEPGGSAPLKAGTRRPRPCHHGRVLHVLLTGYPATGDDEAADVARMTRLAASAADPWARSLPLHFTASALVVHPASRRVLLRWHVKLGLWLQVGGHADPGETDALAIALREAREETGLTDLVPWPDGSLRHAAVCHVPASGREPEHEHADLRYILATGSPQSIVAENPESPLRWLSVDEARHLVGGNNLRRTLDRLDDLFAA
jgi:8-oxo-dGTP pyrophosphatase MutT (NUDIX family)